MQDETIMTILYILNCYGGWNYYNNIIYVCTYNLNCYAGWNYYDNIIHRIKPLFIVIHIGIWD